MITGKAGLGTQIAPSNKEETHRQLHVDERENKNREMER
jgi:hypothetical protein